MGARETIGIVVVFVYEFSQAAEYIPGMDNRPGDAVGDEIPEQARQNIGCYVTFQKGCNVKGVPKKKNRSYNQKKVSYVGDDKNGHQGNHVVYF